MVILCLDFPLFYTEKLNYNSQNSLSLALTRLTMISSETNQAHARVVIHTINTGTATDNTCVIHTVVDV